jgi:hypothetical protein
MAYSSRVSVGVFSFAIAVARLAAPASAAPSSSATVVSAAPVGSSSPTPSPDLTISGIVRAYQFDKHKAAPGDSESAFNLGVGIHGEYAFGTSGFFAGVGAYGADPLGTNGLHPENNSLVDNSLPGYAFVAFPETYVGYKTHRFKTTVGNQFLSFDWANEGDSRIMPQSFQGITAAYDISPHLSLTAARIIRFEDRTASHFDSTTLLTGNTAVPGFLLMSLHYNTDAVSALLEDYSFYDIANLQYAELTKNLKGFRKAHISTQYVGEQQRSGAILGIIQNHTYGAAAGALLFKNVTGSLGFDESPAHYAAGASAGQFYKPAIANSNPLLSYGGIATPYTPSSDPLFTTSIYEGIADTGRTGSSYKFGLAFESTNRRLKIALSRAEYSTTTSIADTATSENDADVTYFLGPVHPDGTYHGFSIRERFADYHSPSVTESPHVTYLRSQFEYAF